MAKIEIYTKAFCGFCSRAKALLDRKGAGFQEIDVTMDRATSRVVAGPDIVSRGFVYVRESEALMDEAKARVEQALEKCEEEKITEWSTIKSNVRDALGRYLFEKTRRRPMILPIIMEM